jgi:hypothetical protein
MTLWLRDGDRCRNCTGFLWRPGPRGGASQNMECVGCKSRFNFVYLAGMNHFITVTEELPSEADGGGRWRTDLFPDVLQ